MDPSCGSWVSPGFLGTRRDIPSRVVSEPLAFLRSVFRRFSVALDFLTLTPLPQLPAGVFAPVARCILGWEETNPLRIFQLRSQGHSDSPKFPLVL